MSPDQALEVDFAALAIADEDFAKIYTANDGHIDFQDPHQVQQLTKSILKRDFDLKIELPGDRLCPPVPVRYQYIRWLQKLVDSTSDSFNDTYDPERPVLGIDIGVGASCIYPLLGSACRPNWRFGGTEIDEQSLECAKGNVKLNDLQQRIRLRKVTLEGPMLDLKGLGIGHADFVMCNPPFFTSKEDMEATHVGKKRSPSAVCTGADIEMITEGGDLGFVARIVEESAVLKDDIQWYSAMLGKLASVRGIVEKLKSMGITNWAVTSLQAGNVTKRWAVAWSYEDFRPSNDVARNDLSNKDVLPFPTHMEVDTNSMEEEQLWSQVEKLMTGLDLKWTSDQANKRGVAFARDNVWSRSARRKREREKQAPHSGSNEQESEDKLQGNAALGVAISVEQSKVIIRWLKGTDHVLFESFSGMLKRVLTS